MDTAVSARRRLAASLPVLAILFLAALATGARAADEAGHYTVIGGPGLATCTEWRAAEQADGVVEAQVRAWVAGFLTSYNRYKHDGRSIAEGHTPDDLITWATRFCDANPSATMAMLAETMIIELRKARSP